MHSTLFDTFRQFDDLRCEYEEARVELLGKADIGLLATAQAAEAIDEALSVKLKNVDELLSRFSAEMEATHQDLNCNIDTRRAQAANILLRARIQMEVVRLMEMKILLPKELWMPESAILLQLDEILLRSQSEGDISDYVALQRASLQILSRVFRRFLQPTTSWDSV
ncbi:hypothetical protein F5879DRAFT_991796 [Lentinula edodes]|nr:hypothetical protein F5879DRAFT_991796 [Lentinula edodes]